MNVDRRKFLSTLIGGVAAGAAVRTFPFRVFSFPKEVKRTIVCAPWIADCWSFRPKSYDKPIAVAIYGGFYGSDYTLIEVIDLKEAKAKYGYDWQPGNPKTQQARNQPSIYCAPYAASTTGIIV